MSPDLLEMVPSGPKPAKTRTQRRVGRRLEPSKVEELIQGYSDGVPVDELLAGSGLITALSRSMLDGSNHALHRGSITLETGHSLRRRQRHNGSCASEVRGHASTPARLGPVGRLRLPRERPEARSGNGQWTVGTFWTIPWRLGRPIPMDAWVWVVWRCRGDVSAPPGPHEFTSRHRTAG